jgi:hypothetical protein
VSKWLSDEEIRAIGTKHGERDGKQDVGDLGMLTATIERVRKNLAKYGADTRTREEAYLVAYVLAWSYELH